MKAADFGEVAFSPAIARFGFHEKLLILGDPPSYGPSPSEFQLCDAARKQTRAAVSQTRKTAHNPPGLSTPKKTRHFRHLALKLLILKSYRMSCGPPVSQNLLARTITNGVILCFPQLTELLGR